MYLLTSPVIPAGTGQQPDVLSSATSQPNTQCPQLRSEMRHLAALPLNSTEPASTLQRKGMPAHQRAQMPKGSREMLPGRPACLHPASTSGTQGQVSSRPQGVGKNAPKLPQPAWCWARAQVLVETWILSRQAKTSSRHSSGPLPGTGWGWGGADTITPRCGGRHLPICSHDSTMPAHGIPRGKG